MSNLIIRIKNSEFPIFTDSYSETEDGFIKCEHKRKDGTLIEELIAKDSIQSISRTVNNDD